MAMHNPIFIDDFSHLDLHLYMILPNKTSTYRWLKHIYIVKISATKTSIYSVFSCIFPCFPWFCLPFSHVLLWLCHRLCHPVPHRGTSQPDLAEHQRGWWVRPPERGHLRGKWNLYFFKDWCNERELSIYIYLVGGIPTHLKNMSSSVGMIIPNTWKIKTCSKPSGIN